MHNNQSLRRPIQPHTILRTIRRATGPVVDGAGALAGLRLRQLRPNSGPLPWAQAWTRISTRREHQGAIITDGQSAARQQILNSLFDRRTELSPIRASTRAPARYSAVASTPSFSRFSTSGCESQVTVCRMPRNRFRLAACSASNTGSTRSASFRSAWPMIAAAARQGPYNPLALAAAGPAQTRPRQPGASPAVLLAGTWLSPR
jgi:hypothetical protein